MAPDGPASKSSGAVPGGRQENIDVSAPGAPFPPSVADELLAARAPERGEADLREGFWRRVLIGRWAIAIGMSTMYAAMPGFGPNRVLIASGMAIASCVQSLFLARVIARKGQLPAFCTVMDHVFVAVAGLAEPAVLMWGMIVLAITLPLAVIAYGRRFSTILVACSTPMFLAMCLWQRPALWPIGLAIFTIGGLGSVALVGFATEEEARVRARYSDILDQLQVVVFEQPAIGARLTYVNDAVGKMLGFTRDEWIEPAWWESRLHPDDHHLWTNSNELTVAGISHQANYRMYSEDGRLVHLLEITRVFEAKGGTRIRGVLVDVTRQAAAEAEASQLSMFVDQIPLALQIFEIPDPDDTSSIRMVAANGMACDNVDATLEELLGEWPRKYSTIDTQPGMLEAFAEVRRTGEALTDHERSWVDETGAPRRANVEAFALGGDYVGVSYEDITDRALAESALRHQANHDALTGLPNRVHLAQQLDEVLSRHTEGDEPMQGALLMMDLNQFKEVNDALGHHHGDRLLVELAGRLREIAGDQHVIARLGGDEFAMVVHGGSSRLAHEIAAEIGRRFAEPIVIDGVTLQSNVSVGIARYPEHATDADGLMQRADAAMYRAKKGGTGVSVFTPDQSTAGIRRLQLLSDLRTAVGNGELMLHYQPRVDFTTAEIEGLEALVRWEHPTWGLLPPDEFIGLAEVSGLIQELTQFVIRQAAADAAALRERGHFLPVAVNLSVRNLYSPDLVEGIMRSLDRHDLEPGLLRVELTESEIMDDPSIAMQVLQRLRSEGIKVSIDDFGTGYSSLSYLRDLPIDEIKIDRSFVADITGGDDVVVRSIIDLGHALGVLVAGEGVETTQQWHHLRLLGCDVAQGYLISRPLPYDTLLRFLDDRREFGTFQQLLGEAATTDGTRA